MNSEAWKAPYIHCKWCKKEVSTAIAKRALAEFKYPTCSYECYKADYFKATACCKDAQPTNCVCVYSYKCETHGQTHVGSHD